MKTIKQKKRSAVKAKKLLLTEKNKKEIFWNLINAGLAGGLVLLGSITTAQEINSKGIFIALLAAGIVIFTKLKDYWSKEESEYCNKAFNFINPV